MNEVHDVARPTLTYLSCFSGIAGLDLGFRQAAEALAIKTRCVGMVEIEAYAAAVLVSAMEEGLLDPCPVWCGDVARCVPPRADAVIGGFPCQPTSTAGRRAGVKDPRWLWPQVERVVDATGCSYVFLENVGGLVGDSEAFGSVLGGLSDRGFSVEWLHLQAAQVGAPHERNRIFILAWREVVDAVGGGRDRGAELPKRRTKRRAASEGTGKASVGDVADERHQRAGGSRGRRTGSADTGSWPRPFPPCPDDIPGWQEILKSDFSYCPALERPVRGMVDGLSRRVDAALRNRNRRIHALGNAVVPAQACSAFLELWRRMHASV